MLDQATQQIIFEQLTQRQGVGEWQLTDTLIEARECRIFQAKSQISKKLVAIKQLRQPKENMGHYFEQQVQLSLKMNKKNSLHRIPEPLLYLDSQSIYCMEWINASTVDYLLWRNFYHQQRQQAIMHNCMTWLKQFHKQSQWKIQAINAQHYLNHLERYLAGIYANTPLIDNPTFNAGQASIKSLAREFHGIETPHAMTHGDFTPSNILISAEASYGIDIGYMPNSPAIDDLVSILTYLAVGYPNMLTHNDMKQDIIHWPLVHILLSAYEPDTSKWPSMHYFSYVFLFQVLKRWMVVEHRYRTVKPGWTDRWRLFKFKQICQALCHKLGEIKP